MEKKQPKKLMLNKETIRNLRSDELSNVAGGTTTFACVETVIGTVGISLQICPTNACGWSGIRWVC